MSSKLSAVLYFPFSLRPLQIGIKLRLFKKKQKQKTGMHRDHHCLEH